MEQAKVTAGRPNSTSDVIPMSCYGVKSRAPPAADDPDVLQQTKLHARQMVTNNPEDPVFYSTCFVRVRHLSRSSPFPRHVFVLMRLRSFGSQVCSSIPLS